MGFVSKETHKCTLETVSLQGAAAAVVVAAGGELVLGTRYCWWPAVTH
jgi:hypothetical protein